MSTAATPSADVAADAAILSALTASLGDGAFTVARFRDNIRIHVTPERLIEVLTALKTRCGCVYLAELGGADYLKYPGRSGTRFEVHYVLRNLDTSGKIVVKAGVDDPDPTLPSVYSLWPGADWMEREVFDMYGIRFEGHPDLRRILMPDEFTAFPLRKDYPLRGRGERHNFPKLTREES
ncbi:NADH-quinone oxidoreductase subunit C [Paludisphaera mucosa]|uniref:NADH-quinone oxidoreductase subunit C n=1 Tax=Paludisphaera mucosa TaxID=3030827 RepID=A0ABT6F5F5_9BACT|nr:NADH-quinone oxidoreductase subunit C [Paludisphaera mucosa]MDG3002810.1 NADH-quinone oxidoreductase subunit C [Paludisphaera mucosa]